MSSLFSIGTSALLANQRALATTGHNIANANTEGYSRQGVEFSAIRVAGEDFGQGVEITSVRRFTDNFANERLLESTTDHAALDTSATLARRLDAVMSDEQTGLAAPLRQFTDALDGLAADPGSVEARVEVLGEADTLAQRFSQIQGNFDQLNTEINSRTQSSVDEINNLSSAIARLNDEIAFNQSGIAPNDLLDQRDRLIKELSLQIDVATAPQDDGSLNVFVGNGQSLVVGSQAQTMTAVLGDNPSEPVRAFLSGSDVTQQVTGGELGGLFSFRSEVMQPAQQKMTDLSQAIVNRLNTLQSSGADFNGNAGTPLFESASSGAGMTVLISDPSLLAAAAAGAPAKSGDNTNALGMAQAMRDPLLGPDSASEANISLVGRLGSQARRLEAAETAQAALVNQHETIRDQTSGVNLDEEAANMMKFQQSYQAAAQIIATASAMFDALLAAAR